MTAPEINARIDRRRRARETYYETYNAGSAIGGQRRKDAIREAIDVATRVQVTPEIVEAAASTGRGFGFDLSEALAAAFRAAGFEVVEE